MTIRTKTRTVLCAVLFTLCFLPAPGPSQVASKPQIFKAPIHRRETLLVSVNGFNTGGNDFSFDAAISADGRFVAFVSYASDLVSGDTNANSDVFVRDLKTGTTTLVSVNSAGTGSGNGRSGGNSGTFGGLVISPQGRFVAFVSDATDLVANDANGNSDVFVRDLKAGTTTLISVNSAGTGSGNGSSDSPVISADGRFVAFVSDATDLTANDANGNSDVFVRD